VAFQQRDTQPVYGATVEEIVPILSAGVYPATFEGIESGHNDQGTYWLWRFKAQNADGEDKEITATSSPRITPRTKAAKWLQGMGATVEIGKDIDFGALVGMPVQIIVIINEAGYSRIDNVLPWPANGIAPAALRNVSEKKGK
jgi:hypothetical protein